MPSINQRHGSNPQTRPTTQRTEGLVVDLEVPEVDAQVVGRDERLPVRVHRQRVDVVRVRVGEAPLVGRRHHAPRRPKLRYPQAATARRGAHRGRARLWWRLLLLADQAQHGAAEAPPDGGRRRGRLLRVRRCLPDPPLVDLPQLDRLVYWWWGSWRWMWTGCGGSARGRAGRGRAGKPYKYIHVYIT